ncbi:MAG: alpha/beta hydrolase [Phenylobacterium sp.]|uniref:alpha/beta fold hydrolase n=1 Tax=Phenylobacterium sp. TaxID=1871053 RepID=UPI0027366B48|nr:alpha/beta hydrolase [Phenylobacterium sp.]MDP3174143.1 alpha/beta hydrolase [Phenylobacterium sp.]
MAIQPSDVADASLTDEGVMDVPGLASRWVRLADGRRAHYVTAGDKGPPIVLLHGSIEGSSGTAGFRSMAVALGASGFRVYCPDRPGYGLADTSRAEYVAHDVKAQVDFLNMFADALCLEVFHLGGNSGGCILSAYYAVTHPERVRSLFLIAGLIGDICEIATIEDKIPISRGKFASNPDFKGHAWQGTEADMAEAMQSIAYGGTQLPADLIKMRTHAGLLQRAGRARFGVQYVPFVVTDPNLRQVYSTKDRLDRLTMPIIYLFGLQDVISAVENGFKQEDAASNIQFFYPDKCGHQGQTDRTELFNQVALEFFSTSRVSWSTAVEAGVSLRRPIDPERVEEPADGFPTAAPEIYANPESLAAGLSSRGLAPVK